MVVIGLGSNLGASSNVVALALSDLAELAVPGSFVHSRLWSTSPVDCPPGSEDFINAAAVFDINQETSPEILLAQLKGLEKRFGRGKKIVRNQPRELDLDLLLFDDEVRSRDRFELPHPRATERLFVLAPLAEIAPNLVWPGTGKTVSELLEALDTDEQVFPIGVDPKTTSG